MKKIIALLFVPMALSTYAQPKLLTQAIISTKTTVVAPEEDDMPNPGGGGGAGTVSDEVRVMRFMGDGETKTTTWLKNDMIKTFSETEMGRTSIIRDNGKKITTTIMEMMGKKFGFYATDEEQAELRKRMDSMMQSRNRDGAPSIAPTAPKIDILYFEETKKISGYTCNKAVIVTTRANGKTDSSIVWFTPEIKFQGIASTGGVMGGFAAFSPQMAGLNAMEQLKGFPMQYERNMGRGRKMTVVVTKIITDKDIDDKEFAIPKDIEIKSAKDMQNGNGTGGFRMTIHD